MRTIILADAAEDGSFAKGSAVAILSTFLLAEKRITGWPTNRTGVC